MPSWRNPLTLQLKQRSKRLKWRDGGVGNRNRPDHTMSEQQTAMDTLRGVPLDPSAVMGTLLKHPKVSGTTLALRADDHDRKVLIAYVVPYPAQSVTGRELREFAKSRLEPQVVPDIFLVVDRIPLTPEGDIDQHALLSIPIRTSLQDQGFVPPRDTTDILLLGIWNELLGRSVGIDDDFFAEGGHSLLAVELLARIESRTGVHLSIATMLTCSTVRTLSDALVRQAAPAIEGELHTLSAGHGAAPLFLFHGDYTGGGFFSRAIAKAADLDGPLMVVQPLGLSRSKDLRLPDSIEGMAARHLASLRQVQATGPYRLAGYCNGALIAFQAAQQLIEAGEKVEFLCLIDPPPASPWQSQHIKSETFQAFLDQSHVETIIDTPWREEHEYRRWLLNHYYRLSAEYTALPYPGDLTLIFLGNAHPGEWPFVASRHTLHRIPCGDRPHLNAIQDSTAEVAKVFHDSLLTQVANG